MAVSTLLSFSLLVVAAALLHFSSLHIDARATPESHFSSASLVSTTFTADISAPPPLVPTADSPAPSPAGEVPAPFPSATARSTGGRGYGLYGRESSVTADELYKIESQLDEDNDEEEESFDEPKYTTTSSTTPKTYGADTYTRSAAGNTKTVSTAYRGAYGNFGRTPVTSTAATSSYGFGKPYSQEESDLDGHNRNNQKYVEEEYATPSTATPARAQSGSYGANFYYPGSYGDNQQGYHPKTTTTTTPVTSTKAQSYTAGNDVYYNANKQPESSTKSTATPTTYGTYSSSNDNYYNANVNANTNANKYYGMSDTRRPENVRAYYNAAKGLGSTSTTSKAYSGNYAQSGYNSNTQSQNEFASMEEYYRSQEIDP